MRTPEALNRVITSIAARQPAEHWRDDTEVVSVRKQVSALLASENPPAVYGFNTLLGEMDSTSLVDSADQEEMYRNHLVGDPFTASADFVRLMTYAKIQQLSIGGNGITPETYHKLLDFTDYTEALGAWNSSYGAGDVAIGAWWVRALFSSDDMNTSETAASGFQWAPGDLISLISGNFVSTAWGIAALLRYLDTAAHFFVRYGSTAVLRSDQLLTHDDGVSAAHSDLREHFQDYTATGIQLPVSLREATSAVVAVLESIQHMVSALDLRLSTCSGNPLFISSENSTHVENISQNSYLDHRLTMSATNALQTTAMMSGLTQRAVAYLAAQGKHNAGSGAKIQHPKVGTALLLRQNIAHTTLPAHFTGSESEGVEDFWDLSLLTCEKLIESTKGTQSVLSVFDATTDALVEERSIQQVRGILYRLAFGAEDGDTIAAGAQGLSLP